jgi:hypothetical protein
MDKESYAPMVNVNVILLDTQKADVRVVGHVRGGYARHQESKKSERQPQQGVKSICSLENLSSFQQNTCHENDRSRPDYRLKPAGLQI